MTVTDKILIRQLEVHAVIGIHDWERQQSQPLYFDLDISFDCSQAAQTDNIKHALDYFTVSEKVTEFVKTSSFELIETLAEQVANLVLKQFPCKKIKLTLFKPQAIENTETVGVCITRTAK